MKDKPIVSILVPCYNVEVFLPQCLDSIISQTYKDLQIVLVDDGSTDSTLSVAKEYALKDSRIEVYYQENNGVAAARNALLSYINGKYFLFIDSDDWIEPNMIEFLLTCAEQECADMVTCDMVKNDQATKTAFCKKTYNRNEAIERFLYHKEFRGSLCNKLTNLNLLLKEPRFHRGISYGEDALFCWELLKEANKVIYTDRQLYHYRMNQNSLSHSTFGPKKLSGHIVWTKLCNETKQLYPEILDIARARFCIEATLLLRDAAHCRYAEKHNIKMLQQTIKKHWHCLNKIKITSLKMKVYAFLACRSYWLAGKL